MTLTTRESLIDQAVRNVRENWARLDTAWSTENPVFFRAVRTEFHRLATQKSELARLTRKRREAST